MINLTINQYVKNRFHWMEAIALQNWLFVVAMQGKRRSVAAAVEVNCLITCKDTQLERDPAEENRPPLDGNSFRQGWIRSPALSRFQPSISNQMLRAHASA
jgi:hypothetical protein